MIRNSNVDHAGLRRAEVLPEVARHSITLSADARNDMRLRPANSQSKDEADLCTGANGENGDEK